MLEEAGVGSTLDPGFVSASGGDDPDRGAPAASSTCSTSSTPSFSSEGEGSFDMAGETWDGLGEADMEVAEESGTLGMSRCLVRSSDVEVVVTVEPHRTTRDGRARWLSAQL